VDRVDSKLEKMNEKLDAIVAKQGEMNVTLFRLTDSVEVHVKRTGLLEERVDLLAGDLKPVEDHVTMVNGALKFLVYLGAVVGLVAGLLKIFEFFHR
jgi:uncharacterized membrane protein YheB (UPF0754 family)